MSTAFTAGLLAGYGVAVPVGPVATYLVALTARTSLRVGLGAAAGVATVDGGYALLAGLGGTAVAAVLDPIARSLRWGAAAVLLVVAARFVIAAVRAHPSGPGRRVDSRTGVGRAYATFVGLTAINPTTVVYFAALIAGLRTSDSLSTGASVAFALAVLLASFSWQALLAGGGAAVGHMLTGRVGMIATAAVSAAVSVYLAVKLVTAG